MIELKKCQKCNSYLIPFETSEGIWLLHPHNPECQYHDINKAVQIEFNVLDEALFEIYTKTHGKGTYLTEHVFEAYEALLKESMAKKPRISLIEWIKEKIKKKKA